MLVHLRLKFSEADEAIDVLTSGQAELFMVAEGRANSRCDCVFVAQSFLAFIESSRSVEVKVMSLSDPRASTDPCWLSHGVPLLSSTWLIAKE